MALSVQTAAQPKDKAMKEVQDTGDEAQALFMEKLQSSLQLTELDELKLVDDALARIDKGEYGICVDCETPISARRLEVCPYAARCISCQESAER